MALPVFPSQVIWKQFSLWLGIVHFSVRLQWDWRSSTSWDKSINKPAIFVSFPGIRLISEPPNFDSNLPWHGDCINFHPCELASHYTCELFQISRSSSRTNRSCATWDMANGQSHESVIKWTQLQSLPWSYMFSK